MLQIVMVFGQILLEKENIQHILLYIIPEAGWIQEVFGSMFGNRGIKI